MCDIKDKLKDIASGSDIDRYFSELLRSGDPGGSPGGIRSYFTSASLSPSQQQIAHMEAEIRDLRETIEEIQRSLKRSQLVEDVLTGLMLGKEDASKTRIRRLALMTVVAATDNAQALGSVLPHLSMLLQTGGYEIFRVLNTRRGSIDLPVLLVSKEPQTALEAKQSLDELNLALQHASLLKTKSEAYKAMSETLWNLAKVLGVAVSALGFAVTISVRPLNPEIKFDQDGIRIEFVKSDKESTEQKTEQSQDVKKQQIASKENISSKKQPAKKEDTKRRNPKPNTPLATRFR